jgi:hypothetical protein
MARHFVKQRTLDLAEPQLDRLALEAQRRGISVAELVRRFVDQGLDAAGTPWPENRHSTGTALAQHREGSAGGTYKEGEERADSPPGTEEQVGQKQQRKARRGSPKISSVPPETPLELVPVLTEWLEYKSHRRQGYTALGASKILKYLQEIGAARARAAVDFSIRNRYDGLFEPSRNGGGSRASPTGNGGRRMGAHPDHAEQLRKREEGIVEWQAPDLRE